MFPAVIKKALIIVGGLQWCNFGVNKVVDFLKVCQKIWGQGEIHGAKNCVRRHSRQHVFSSGGFARCAMR